MISVPEEKRPKGRRILEIAIVLSRTATDVGKALTAAAQLYKIDTAAITLKVKQEFAAKDKAKTGKKNVAKPTSRQAKKAA